MRSTIYGRHIYTGFGCGYVPYAVRLCFAKVASINARASSVWFTRMRALSLMTVFLLMVLCRRLLLWYYLSELVDSTVGLVVVSCLGPLVASLIFADQYVVLSVRSTFLGLFYLYVCGILWCSVTDSFMDGMVIPRKYR